MKRFKKVMTVLLFILFAFVFLRSAVYLITYYMDSRASQGAFESLAALVEEEPVTEAPAETEPAETEPGAPKPRVIMNKYKALYEQNPDLAGWLTVDGTNINYPVMFTGPELDRVDYYIHRDYEGN